MVEKITENKVLDSYNTLIPYLSIILQDDAVFSITDTEKFLTLINEGKLQFSGKGGDVIPEGSAAYKALQKEEPVFFNVPREVFGVAVKAISIPVKDSSGIVVGTIGVARSLERQDAIYSLSQNLSSSFNQISVTTNQIAAGIQNTASSNEQILNDIGTTNDEVRNTDDILAFVKKIASQTNLLGLNAAIEAARAGEMGRGFGVVAEEIRKLSDSSAESINKIESMLKNIQKSIVRIKENTNETNGVLQEQAAGLQQLTVAIEELNSTAYELENMAEKF